jgi:hypothetical protein
MGGVALLSGTMCAVGAFEVRPSGRRGHVRPHVSAAAAESSWGPCSLVDQMLTTRSEIA